MEQIWEKCIKANEPAKHKEIKLENEEHLAAMNTIMKEIEETKRTKSTDHKKNHHEKG